MRAQDQHRCRILDEYLTIAYDGNNNTPDKSNAIIASAFNNLAQELATLQTVNHTTWATLSHVTTFDTFVSIRPFYFPSFYGST